MDEYIEEEGDNTGQVTEDVAEDEGGQFVPPTETTEESADGDDPPQQVAEAAEGEQPYVMMEGGGEIQSGVVLVDENNQVRSERRARKTIVGCSCKCVIVLFK